MKERHQKMVRLLLTLEGTMRIDDLARLYSVGSRTISRDLDYLEKWLALRGAFLERKTNRGIRVLTYGKPITEILDSEVSAESFFRDLEAPQRQNCIGLYLLYNTREMKISEIARTFFVSDTSVWNDLAQLEQYFNSRGITLERRKGVGIRILGDEGSLRLAFLSLLTRTFTTKAIIPYLFLVPSHREPSREVKNLEHLMENLRIKGDHRTLFGLIRLAEEYLDLQFTLAGESLLYFYLLLSAHRIHAGELITLAPEEACMERYREVAAMILPKLTSRTFSGELPAAETAQLGLLLEVLELGDIGRENYLRINPFLPPSFHDFTQRLLSRLGVLEYQFFYRDTDFIQTITAALFALVVRIKCRIPHWYDQWEPLERENRETGLTEEALGTMLKEEFGISPGKRDLRYLILHFKAAALRSRQVGRNKLRCIICCFEGIGLASYLFSVISREIPGIEVVEATAAYKFNQEYLDLNRIDMVLSTFPIPELKTPVIIMELPLKREEIENAINGQLSRLAQTPRPAPPVTAPAEGDHKITVDGILDFISHFEVIPRDKPQPLKQTIHTVAVKVGDDKKHSAQIEKALLRREALGSLFIEEFSIRIVHGKTAGVANPRGGVVHRVRDNQEEVSEELVVYLLAPDPCPEEDRKLLSAFSVAVLENPLLRSALAEGDRERIRKTLLDVYHWLL